MTPSEAGKPIPLQVSAVTQAGGAWPGPPPPYGTVGAALRLDDGGGGGSFLLTSQGDVISGLWWPADHTVYYENRRAGRYVLTARDALPNMEPGGTVDGAQVCVESQQSPFVLAGQPITLTTTFVDPFGVRVHLPDGTTLTASTEAGADVVGGAPPVEPDGTGRYTARFQARLWPSGYAITNITASLNSPSGELAVTGQAGALTVVTNMKAPSVRVLAGDNGAAELSVSAPALGDPPVGYMVERVATTGSDAVPLAFLPNVGALALYPVSAAWPPGVYALAGLDSNQALGPAVTFRLAAAAKSNGGK